MGRPQRNPNRQYPNGTTRSISFNQVNKFFTPPGPKAVLDDGAVSERSTEPLPGSQETSPTPMNQLNLFAAMKSEDLSLAKKDPALKTRHARDRRRHAMSSPTLRGSKSLPKETCPKEDPNDHEQSRHQPKSPSSSASSSIPATVKASQSERRTQPVCMRGMGDWEPVIAMIDDSSRTSLLDPDTANMLGLTLHPIPRRRALRTALSNSSASNGRFYASNVGLRSVSIDFPPVTVSIMVAPISVKDANVIIGWELLQCLEDAAKQGATETSLNHRDVAMNGSENSSASVAGNSSFGGDAPWFPESSSTSPDMFSAPSFPGHLASVHRGDETYWIGDMLPDPEFFGIETRSESWELVGCGGSFEGGESGTIHAWP